MTTVLICEMTSCKKLIKGQMIMIKKEMIKKKNIFLRTKCEKYICINIYLVHSSTLGMKYLIYGIQVFNNTVNIKRIIKMLLLNKM